MTQIATGNKRNAPPELIYRAFDMLRPADRMAGALALVDKIIDDDYVKGYRMFARWGADVLPLPGEFFRQAVKELMWDNKLLAGDLRLGGRRVDLASIGIPLLHAIAEHDHIVPYDAAKSALPSKPGSSRNRQTACGGSAYIPPVSRSRVCRPSGMSRVVTLMTPPNAAEPYTDEPAPFRISMLAISSTDKRSQLMPPRSPWFIGTPSTVMRTREFSPCT